MSKQKKLGTKKILIIGGVLLLVQLGYVALFSSEGQKVNIKDAITKQVNNNPVISEERKDLVQLQLALAGFKVKNKNYPKQLKDLIPEFIDAVPLDPKTGTQYKYELDGNRYILGDAQPKSNKIDTKTKQVDALDQESRLIAYLDQSQDQDAFTYDPNNKKDPFRSYDLTSRTVAEVGDSPLESYPYENLKLSAVIEGMGEPRAVIEDPNGKGHVVGIGAKVGNLGGVIGQIEKNKVIILEKQVDFTGEVTSRTIEMHIR